MKENEFGIILSCYRGDYAYLKACCESIRDSGCELPICVIVDGNFSIDGLTNRFGASAIYRDQVDVTLRSSFGYGHTKMVAFWHSPFERFLYVDADVIWWGDITVGLPWNQYDFIYNEPHELITPFIQNGQYFDPDKLFSTEPYFEWRDCKFFNSGCFAARRGIFEISEYVNLLSLQRNDPTIFISGEQGILNYMLFRHIDNGTLSAREWPLQVIVAVCEPHKLEQRFQIERGKPKVNYHDRRAIHWAGPKPSLLVRSDFRKPMTHYRLRYQKLSRSDFWRFGIIGLALEELNARLEQHYGGSVIRMIKSKIVSHFLNSRD